MSQKRGGFTDLVFFFWKESRRYSPFIVIYLLTSLVYIVSLGHMGNQLKDWQLDHWKSAGLALSFIMIFRTAVTLTGQLISHHLVTDARKKLIRNILENFPYLRLRLSHSTLTHRLSEEFPTLISLVWSSGLEVLSQSLIIFFITLKVLLLSPLLAMSMVSLMTLVGTLSFTLKRILKSWVTGRQERELKIFGIEQSFFYGFDRLKLDGKLLEKTRAYDKNLDSLRKIEMKISTLNGSSSAISWGLKFSILTLLMTPFFRFTSPQTLYWTFLLLGAVTQWVWAFQSLVAAQVHYENCLPFFEEHVTKEQRQITSHLEIKASQFKVYYSPDLPVTNLPMLNFHWLPGDRIWIQGESGIGKSTLIKSLLGLHHNWSGEVLFPEPKNYVTGYVPQSPWLDPEISLKENLGFIGRTADLEILVKDLGLCELMVPAIEDKRPGSVYLNPSRGQVTRLAILRELFKQPSLLIVDEPTASLNQEMAAQVLKILKNHMAGKILVVCEHKEALKRDFNPTQVLNLSPTFIRKTDDSPMTL